MTKYEVIIVVRVINYQHLSNLGVYGLLWFLPYIVQYVLMGHTHMCTCTYIAQRHNLQYHIVIVPQSVKGHLLYR
jgi:hypothetical protein